MKINIFKCNYDSDPYFGCLGCGNTGTDCPEYTGYTVEILNYTPHTVNIIIPNKDTKNFPSVGEARCSQDTVENGCIGDIPLTSTSFGEVTGLPKEEKRTYYIVSRLVREALSNRKDLLVPNEIVRDDLGKIIGCKSLATN